MKNEQLYLHYSRRAADFKDYGIVAALMALVFWIPVYGVLSSFIGEETAEVLAPYVVFAPAIFFGLRNIYYSLMAWAVGRHL